MTVAEAVGTGEDSIAPRHVILTVGVSVCGLLIHNLEEFSPSILLAPETWVPASITVLLGLAILRRPGSGVFLATAGWAAIIIVIGGVSVLPLPIWPFAPEQTVSHYAAHAIYALAQIPFLWIARRGYRASARSD